MSDISQFVERLQNAHQRLDLHDGRINRLEVNTAEEKVRAVNIEKSLTKIQDGITWVLRLVVGALILAAIGFALKGGFHVGP
ncbi:hypothetical protein GCM10010873_16400 [Cypionkella aquatica]|uniref:Hemolysin XhlA n=1 Tax=Cypionkella aquatica TaxID=1756042 RepID=A0AA37U722_9RHOB|nr:hemolysin XhlA family protein [Cypionkella aquatica]GLS86666.1 hypothetical protein GCM10010873_16400 [Cypionkella aquatica]